MFYSKFSCDGHTNPKFANSGEFAEGCNNNYHYFHIKIALQLLIKSLIHVVYFSDHLWHKTAKKRLAECPQQILTNCRYINHSINTNRNKNILLIEDLKQKKEKKLKTGHFRCISIILIDTDVIEINWKFRFLNLVHLFRWKSAVIKMFVFGLVFTAA